MLHHVTTRWRCTRIKREVLLFGEDGRQLKRGRKCTTDETSVKTGTTMSFMASWHSSDSEKDTYQGCERHEEISLHLNPTVFIGLEAE